MKTLVLGLGNELFGDDGVAFYIIENLKKEFQEEETASGARQSLSGSIEFLASSCSGLALLDLILGYDRLFIIDTIKQANPQTGLVRILKEEDLRYVPGPSPHYLSFPQVLQIGRAVGLPVPRELTIIAIEAKNIYQLGETLSPEMKACLPSIIHFVKSLLGLGVSSDESQRNQRS